jgi:hypothetical protein
MRLDADVAGVSPVPVQMWQRVSPAPVQTWQGVSPLRADVQSGTRAGPVPVQMWTGGDRYVRFRRRPCSLLATAKRMACCTGSYGTRGGKDGGRTGTSGSSDSARARSRAAWTTLPITAKRARATTAHARTAGSAESSAPPVTRQACTQFNRTCAALRRGNKNENKTSRGAIGAFRMTKQQHSSSPRDPRRNLRPCRHWQSRWPAVPRPPLRTLRLAGRPWAGSGSLRSIFLSEPPRTAKPRPAAAAGPGPAPGA